MAAKRESESTETFWKEMAESLGENVLSYTLGQYIGGLEPEGPLWGILYMTETRLFFRHFPQQSWISSLVSTKPGGGGEEVVLEIPLAGATLDVPGPPGILQRLLGTGNRVYGIVLPDKRTFFFTAEHTQHRFIAVLREHIPS